MGSRGPGEADRLFPQSVLLQPPLTHGAARRRADNHGKKGTNKNNSSTTQKSLSLEGWWSSGGRPEGEKKVQENLTGN